jgi:hypothetical protein
MPEIQTAAAATTKTSSIKDRPNASNMQFSPPSEV